MHPIDMHLPRNEKTYTNALTNFLRGLSVGDIGLPYFRSVGMVSQLLTLGHAPVQHVVPLQKRKRVSKALYSNIKLAKIRRLPTHRLQSASTRPYMVNIPSSSARTCTLNFTYAVGKNANCTANSTVTAT